MLSTPEALFCGHHLHRKGESGDIVPSVSVYDSSTLLLRLNHRGTVYQELMRADSTPWECFCAWNSLYWRAFIAPRLPPEPEQFPIDEVTL